MSVKRSASPGRAGKGTEKRGGGKAALPKPVVRSKPGKKAAEKPSPKKAEPTRKTAAKKAAPKKATPAKVEAKQAEAKKAEAKKATKPEPMKKPEAKKPEAEPKHAPVKLAAKRPARSAPERQETTPTRAKEEDMTLTPKPAPTPAAPEGKRAVLRVAGGLRTPNKRKARPGSTPGARPAHGAGEPQSKLQAPKIEINPKLQRAKDVLKNPPPPPPTPPGGKPMSVAQKNRAAAEAAFAKVTANGASPSPAAPVPAAPPSPAVAPPPTGPQQVFGARINERDTITTSLRLARTREETMDAAVQLADRYRLPPDQTLLLKVVELGDARLTKLGLEELLELEDRGRVRGTPELKSALHALRSNDPETMELRDLLLAKLGDAPRVT